LSGLERLQFRSQFVLGPYFIEKLASWKKIKIGTGICITVHPDLNTYQAVNKEKSVTLLGYILDPNNPNDSDSDVINKLSHKIFDGDEPYFGLTYDFGGRWILIVDDGKEPILFTDPAGLRQVVYTEKNSTKDFLCASQPGIIAEVLNLKMDNDAVSFINSFKEKDDEYYWIGDSTPYKEIRHLLPNHFLKLYEGSCSRYWPDKSFERISLDEGIKKSSRYLEGLMISASKRYNLILSLSSGLDSRLLLAASRKIKNKLSCLTEIKSNMDKTHADVSIPSKLLPKLDIVHDIVETPTEITNSHFNEIFHKNVPFAHEKWALKAEFYFNLYNLNKVDVIGTVSDIAKFGYDYFIFDDKNVTLQRLSECVRMQNDGFALTHLDKWIKGIGDIFNYSKPDLFYWEQRIGRWAATNYLEFDIGWQDIFAPYNCRALLNTMLTVDAKFRMPPNYILCEKMIHNLWPAVLSQPINPHRKKGSLLKRIKRKLVRLKQNITN
jgi:hypothetical protein